MTDKLINIDLRFVDKNELPEQKSYTSTFKLSNDSDEVIIDYKYRGEPNSGRILLRLSGILNGKNIIESYDLSPNIELPYQYPGNFELFNTNGRFVAVPHNKGIYLLHMDTNHKRLIKYQTHKFRTSYFVDDLFVLVEDKGCKIVELVDFKEQVISFGNSPKFFINAVQVLKNEIYIVVNDVEYNQLKLSSFSKQDFSLDKYSEYILSDMIESKDLESKLRFDRIAKLVFVPDYKYNSIIDSWRFIQNKSWNSLIGRVVFWFEPEEDGEHFIRREKYDYVELSINTSIN